MKFTVRAGQVSCVVRRRCRFVKNQAMNNTPSNTQELATQRQAIVLVMVCSGVSFLLMLIVFVLAAFRPADPVARETFYGFQTPLLRLAAVSMLAAFVISVVCWRRCIPTHNDINQGTHANAHNAEPDAASNGGS